MGDLYSSDEVDQQRRTLADALNNAWGDFVGDTGCFPDAITVEATKPDVLLDAEFGRGNFVHHAVLWLHSAGYTIAPLSGRSAELTDG